MAGLCAGADGAIAELANIAPAAHVALRDAIQDADLETAQRYQRAIAQLGTLSLLVSPPMRALKVATNAAMSPINDMVRTEVDDPATLRRLALERTHQIFDQFPDELGALRIGTGAPTGSSEGAVRVTN